MFYAIAAALCCAVLFIVLSGTSLVSAGMLWAGRRIPGKLSPRAGANLLFAFRCLPLFLTILITLGFALPSILEFEPRSSSEIMGLRLLVLAACGGLALVGFAIRSWRVIRATRQAQKLWRSHSTRVQPEGVRVPVYCADGAYPLLAVTGVFRPEIYVTNTVAQNLSANELSAAIAHELAHVRSRDNLKQMVLKITQPPQWLNPFRKSDAAWLKASEVAADEAALASGATALDLSSALVKVGQLSRLAPVSNTIAASYLLPETAESCIAVRVMHLEKLLSGERGLARLRHDHGNKTWTVLSLVLLVVSYGVCVHAVLPRMHEALELLVR